MRIIASITGSLNAGTYQTPGVALGTPADALEIAITRAGLPAGPVAALQLEVSEDGGATWRSIGSVTLSGGDAIQRDGSVAAESLYRVSLAGPGGESIPFDATDRVRAKLTLLQAVVSAHVEARAL